MVVLSKLHCRSIAAFILLTSVKRRSLHDTATYRTQGCYKNSPIQCQFFQQIFKHISKRQPHTLTKHVTFISLFWSKVNHNNISTPSSSHKSVIYRTQCLKGQMVAAFIDNTNVLTGHQLAINESLTCNTFITSYSVISVWYYQHSISFGFKRGETGGFEIEKQVIELLK